MTPTPSLATAAQAGYRLAHVVRAEWTKLVSLRSTRWTLIAFPVTAVILGVVIGAVSGAGWSDLSAADKARWDPTNNILAGLIPGYLVIPVLGVLLMSSEHHHGTLRTTFAAVPRRPLVLAAKGLVLAAATFVLCEAVTFVTFLASRPVMGDAPRPGLGDPGVLRALVLTGAFLALMGLFGLGLGTIVRHTGAAVAAYATLAILSGNLLYPLPGQLWRFGPLIILANSISAAEVQPEFLSPAMGFAVMTLYTTVALAAARAVLVRRDA